MSTHTLAKDSVNLTKELFLPYMETFVIIKEVLENTVSAFYLYSRSSSMQSYSKVQYRGTIGNNFSVHYNRGFPRQNRCLKSSISRQNGGLLEGACVRSSDICQSCIQPPIMLCLLSDEHLYSLSLFYGEVLDYKRKKTRAKKFFLFNFLCTCDKQLDVVDHEF